MATEVYATAFDGADPESKPIKDWQNWCLAWATGLKVLFLSNRVNM